MRLSLLQLSLYKPVITVKDPWGLYMYYGLSLFFSWRWSSLNLVFRRVTTLVWSRDLFRSMEMMGLVSPRNPGWDQQTYPSANHGAGIFTYMTGWLILGKCWDSYSSTMVRRWDWPFNMGFQMIFQQFKLTIMFYLALWSGSERVGNPCSLLAIPSTPWFDQQKVGLGQQKW